MVRVVCLCGLGRRWVIPHAWWHCTWWSKPSNYNVYNQTNKQTNKLPSPDIQIKWIGDVRTFQLHCVLSRSQARTRCGRKKIHSYAICPEVVAGSGPMRWRLGRCRRHTQKHIHTYIYIHMYIKRYTHIYIYIYIIMCASTQAESIMPKTAHLL